MNTPDHMKCPETVSNIEPSKGGKMDIIYGEYPPNYETILAAFPMAGNRGVVFAYGDKIFVPSGIELTHPLKVHEATHGIRQKEFGLDAWWQRYISDDGFRYYEELVAHFAEYMAMLQESEHGNDAKFRKRIRKFIAKKLSHPLYCGAGGATKAQRDLKNMEQEYKERKPVFNAGT